jgi:DNA invertase Pin-like site-specific DNA recombinase
MALAFAALRQARRELSHLTLHVGWSPTPSKRDGRTELQKVLGVLGDGDTFVVTRHDRLGRSLRDLANVAHEIEEAGANLKVLEQKGHINRRRAGFPRHAGGVLGL